jgi:dihydroflavonol-4-reductase
MNVVLGASGFLGSHAVRALLGAGVPVRAIARRPRRALHGLDAQRLPADLDDPSSLDAVLAGARSVVHAAAPYPKTSLDRGVIYAAVRQTRAVLDAVARSGAERFLFVSSTATVAPAVGRASDERDQWPVSSGFGVYHDLKWHLEALVRAETRFRAVTVCPAACLGPGDWRVGTSAWLVATARGHSCPHPDGPVSFVDVRDVGAALAALCTHADPPERLLLSAATTRLHPLLVSVARRYGAPAPPPPLSDEDARAFADRAEQDIAATGGRPELSRELVDLVTHGVVIDGRLAQRTLGISYTPLAATLDAFDGWARTIGLLPRPVHQEHAP